ncbi:glycoside hydrolase family 125 protein [Chitinophaga sp. GCM10012297]|uniref:Glycoside hydrolase family 125 protein n=1 Tax=Chitinophaga chungangae TaxID=2821488 RepID=A0ABS3Y856_9BACT|nr:glycoside hydrolase family 125 protein [Chitinophaga chungangae]MBO9150855.1 glycoside hydrolase family 125 protein [Chitinophaga chungangae]
MSRRKFLRQSAVLSSAILLRPALSWAGTQDFPVVRIPAAQRKFRSEAVEKAIAAVKSKSRNQELSWLFENCFPNTLDTTVEYTQADGRPDTYVITGDIDAMWLRDSTAQVSPYLPLVKEDKELQHLIAGVINHQVKCILKDPYANAFYKDPNKQGEWKTDLTDMKPGIHERKWEIDSLCYPIRLGYMYWKNTGDTSPFNDAWKSSIALTVKTFKEQQRKDGPGPYHFQRNTAWATDGVPLAGYGYPVKPVGLICSIFRPSDDATIFPFLIPSNFFAVVSLRQAAEMVQAFHKDAALAAECRALAAEVEKAIQQYAIVTHPKFGKVYAFEVNGFGSFNLMDDANVPSLLALPYLGAVKPNDPVYANTRKLILSSENPFFFEGKAGKGIGSPHTGMQRIWPISVVMQALTSHNETEIKQCLAILQKCHAGKGFMHESFQKDDPAQFTRSWFAWANTIFGELIWKIYRERPHLLA